MTELSTILIEDGYK